MRVTEAELPGVLILEPDVFGDARGFFMETWKAAPYAEILGTSAFVQDNLSRSTKGVLRGLHYQTPHEQGKLVWAARGRIFDVAVDLREGSPSFGRWAGVELSDENHRQFWIPPGYAHGFLTLSDVADVAYKCTEVYAPESEHVLRWDDPDMAIAWPDCGPAGPQLSSKDSQGKSLREAVLPTYRDDA
ncbi:MAG: dTDP-4-dehydrorhamnose 3,5-epimerase [Alphaproteobacteria bacterium]|nr:dTDP-4-dehydrorhamnose 3,5-epimerase [Alphaproteobacteria bacterium]